MDRWMDGSLAGCLVDGMLLFGCQGNVNGDGSIGGGDGEGGWGVEFVEWDGRCVENI